MRYTTFFSICEFMPCFRLFVCLPRCNYVDGAILNLMVILSPPLSLSSTHSGVLVFFDKKKKLYNKKKSYLSYMRAHHFFFVKFLRILSKP